MSIKKILSFILFFHTYFINGRNLASQSLMLSTSSLFFAFGGFSGASDNRGPERDEDGKVTVPSAE